jgi:ribosome-associated protein
VTFTVPDAELRFRATRAGGPGGQHVNTSSTRVEVVWDVAASPSLTDAQRERLLRKLSSRIDSRGRLRVAAGERRSQLQNRQAAQERLNTLVAEALRRRRPRKPTKPSKAAVERRLTEKRRRRQRKHERRPPGRED